MADKDLVEVRFHCYPDHDLDVVLKSDVESEVKYCWNIHEGTVSKALFAVSSMGPCPKCGATVDIKAITAMGTFLDATKDESDGTE